MATPEDVVLTQQEESTFWRWVKTSLYLQEKAESDILRSVCTKQPEQLKVFIDDQTFIHTLKVGEGPPLVLLHGFGAGSALWAKNLDSLSKSFTVYAIDLLGFGRSSRPCFTGTSCLEAESFFVDSIDLWRSQLGLTRFTLLGHSLGGYIAACYALDREKHVEHLVLADPWGIPQSPERVGTRLPFTWKLVGKLLSNVSPFTIVRAAGPKGRSLIGKVRPDLGEKWAAYVPDSNLIFDYIYHSNAQTPASGEDAFYCLTLPFGFARDPLINRLPSLSKRVPVAFLYGEHSWMDSSVGQHLCDTMGDHVTLDLIPEAGHHIYIDNAEYFNHVVLARLSNQAM